jgi:hypothetical protein
MQVIKSRRMRQTGRACGWYGREERTGVYRVLVGRPEEWSQIGGLRLRWEENIEMFLQEVGRRSMDWIDVAQDRDRWGALVNALMNLWIP